MENKDYQHLVAQIKTLVTQARVKALININHQLLQLHWHIEKIIVEQQTEKGRHSHLTQKEAHVHSYPIISYS